MPRLRSKHTGGDHIQRGATAPAACLLSSSTAAQALTQENSYKKEVAAIVVVTKVPEEYGGRCPNEVETCKVRAAL